jgi:hypothetical protein
MAAGVLADARLATRVLRLYAEQPPTHLANDREALRQLHGLTAARIVQQIKKEMA